MEGGLEGGDGGRVKGRAGGRERAHSVPPPMANTEPLLLLLLSCPFPRRSLSEMDEEACRRRSAVNSNPLRIGPREGEREGGR